TTISETRGCSQNAVTLWCSIEPPPMSISCFGFTGPRPRPGAAAASGAGRGNDGGHVHEQNNDYKAEGRSYSRRLTLRSRAEGGEGERPESSVPVTAGAALKRDRAPRHPRAGRGGARAP